MRRLGLTRQLVMRGVACGVAALLAGVVLAPPVHAQPDVTATHVTVTARDLQAQAKTAAGVAVGSSTVRLQAGRAQGVILSPPLEMPFAFNAVAPHWAAQVPAGARVEVALRTSLNGTDWTRWTPTAHPEAVAARRADGTPNPYAGHTAADPVLAPPASRYVQFRLTLHRGNASPVLQRLLLYVADAAGAPRAAPKAEDGAAPRIITRDAWGAQPPRAGYRYAQATHLALHHTASTSAGAADTQSECAAAVRAIQDYHMNTRGWIDIGYNYVICQTGTIFQGREDGNDQRDVVGAHDAYNAGSVGVSGLGYFHPPHDQQPTSALLAGFVELFGWIAARRAIDPTGTSYYASYGALVPTVYGHRDVRATACPGDHLYAERAMIRRRVAEQLDETALPEAVAVSGNYPNPFRTMTQIDVALPQPRSVTVEVYDARGRHVATRRFGRKPAGTHTLTVRADGWASGAYVYRLNAGRRAVTGTMRVVR